MASPPLTITRRALLVAAGVLPAAGCTQDEPRGAGSSAGIATTGAPAPPVASASATAAVQTVRPELVRLERRYDAVLGLYALAVDTGATIVHRADERFAICSTFKGLAAAAVVDRNPLSHLDRTRVRYTTADLMTRATPFTREHVATGMTLREACQQAILHSDGTAGNLLLRELGGPKQLTAYLRGLGDTVTRVDQLEPALAEDTPGDLRDTSTPRAIGTDYRRIVLGGTVLPSDKRRFLVDLLEGSMAGSGRLRAGLPRGWRLAHKSGTGATYGTCNDIGIAWPPNSGPLVIAIMSRKLRKSAPADALLAEATRQAVAALSR